MSNNSIASRNPLLIPDLFHCILEYLIKTLPNERPSKEERQILAVLARTCHAFSEPCLNRLWRRLNSLLPLIRSFAAVADETRAKTPPSSREWLVISRYSHRVQELNLGNEYLSLHFLQRTRLVLPNLRVFRWKRHRRTTPSTDFPFDSIAFVWPLFTSNIVTLELELDNTNDSKYQPFLKNYPHRCPNLESIKLNISNGTKDHKPVSQALSQAICGNANWHHVELFAPIDNIILKHLGMSSTLKTVSLTLAPQTSRPDEACFRPEDTPFCSVTDLALILWNSLDFATCLLRDRDQLFRCFQVTLHTLTVATEVSSLLTALASPQRTHSLQAITVNHLPHIASGHGLSPGDGNGIFVRQPLLYETLRPLASLVQLRTLVIDLNHPASLNDQQFASLVYNWPLLEALQMTWTRGEHSSASMTLKVLSSLLISCPELREIGLTLDAMDVPVAGTYADVCSPFITSPMQLHNCPLKDPDSVADFLVKLLPSMPRVRWTHTSHMHPTDNVGSIREYQRLWMQVNQRMHHPPP
ncbi:hypothetical protein OG21DRAFT_1488534 [Imleria badia]|nr:hypothetical protein OG21DRAFT_1488534 [Imleria badia]